ncbi:MAG: hypothetical protein WBW31_07640 [Candidatus Sulfotelmatobacter sp.]
MRRAVVVTLVIFGIPAAAFGQAAASDSQTLQALLTEVRELRQDLRTSLARVQSGQILLSRLQAQQIAVTRASERLDEARSFLAGTQNRLKHLAVDVKQLEDTLSSEGNLTQQRELQGRIAQSKTELEASTDEEQQRQATEIDAERQLRTEQDKLNALEAQLDGIIKAIGDSGGQPGRSQH